VDDLPEFLGERDFPAWPRKLLFDPADSCPDDPSYRRARSWAEVTTLVLGQEGVWGRAVSLPHSGEEGAAA
jgi:hypothetical protein